MKLILLTLAIFLLIGCSKKTPVEVFSEIDNPITRDLNNNKFQFYYDVEEYKELIPLNDTCNDYIEELPATSRKYLVIAFEQEAVSFALEDFMGILESFSGTSNKAGSLERYMEYYSGGAASLITLSHGAKQFLKEYDISIDDQSEFEKVLSTPNMKTCVISVTILGALGFDNLAKSTYERMAETATRNSRQNFLNQFN